jgi:hypothetical protein
MAALIDAVREMTALGLAVHPLRTGRKEPALRDWPARATACPEEAVRLFRAHPGCNLGIATGARSGVFVLDIDRKSGVDGLTTLVGLEERCGHLPATWLTETQSGGLHQWFALPLDRRIGNRVSFAPGLDIRGEGGFVVAPPSVVGDRPYRWASPPSRAALSEAPQWLLDLAAPPPPPKSQRPSTAFSGASTGHLVGYVASAVEREAHAVAHAPRGLRNPRLFLAAARLGELVAAGLLPRGVVEAVLEAAAADCGLIHDDGVRAVAATISSGLARGSANPRKVLP